MAASRRERKRDLVGKHHGPEGAGIEGWRGGRGLFLNRAFLCLQVWTAVAALLPPATGQVAAASGPPALDQTSPNTSHMSRQLICQWSSSCALGQRSKCQLFSAPRGSSLRRVAFISKSVRCVSPPRVLVAAMPVIWPFSCLHHTWPLPVHWRPSPVLAAIPSSSLKDGRGGRSLRHHGTALCIQPFRRAPPRPE